MTAAMAKEYPRVSPRGQPEAIAIGADVTYDSRSVIGRAVCLAVAVLLDVTAAATIDDAGAADVLRIGTSGDYAPFSLRGKGFDVDVAEAMTRDLGFTIEWVSF